MKRSVIFHAALALSCWACERPATPEGFLLEPGFELRRVAAEPLIQDPVDLEFDEQGRTMVLEMPGYPLEDQQSRLMILHDDNNDGLYDRSTLFADSLRMASSFLPYRQGVLVAAPPYLLWLHDKDRDGAADQVDTLMGGFETGNLQHNVNGLTYGLDNWIYAANGGNDGSPFWWGDSTTVLELRGQDLRFQPETRKLERLGESSGGFGLGMDEFGRVFETHNLEHVSCLVFPGRYTDESVFSDKHGLHNISDHEENGLARIYPVGEQESRMNHPEQSGYFSGACGITWYGGGAFGKTYDSTIWVADVVLNLVHIDKIKTSASAFTAERLHREHDFLASTDRAFRPVNMTVGPDGAMYVVDMYRTVIEHPEWIPDDIEQSLDLGAGKGQGRIYRIRRTGMAPSFDPRQLDSDEGRIASLSSPNQWVRMTAQRLLMEQPLTPETTARLRDLLIEPSSVAKLHSLHILSANALLTEGELLAALEDPSAPFRERALILAEGFPDASPAVFSACIRLLTDPNPRVRMQAALSLSTMDDNSAGYASQRPAVMHALASAAQLPGDTWNSLAIALAAKGAAGDLFASLVSTSADPALLAFLARSASQSATGLAGILAHLPHAAPTYREELLREICQHLPAMPGQPVLPAIEQLEKSADPGLISGLAALRHQLGLPASPQFLALSREALHKATEASLPDSVRLEQLSLLALLPYPEKSEVLFQCLANHEPIAIQEAGLLQLSRHNDPEIGRRLVALWQELGPHIRKYAGDLLLDRELYHDALLTGLENGTVNIGEMNFDLERRRALLWWTDNEDTRRRAGLLFTDAGVNNRQEALETMKPALALQGNSGAGALIFDAQCALCHRYGARGQEVGPVLTDIARKSKATLLHDILDPNAAADPSYINHRVETTDGMVHMGIVAAETDASLTLLKMGGERIAIPKSQIRKLRSLGTSLMMEGFEKSMSHQEMADLLAFLQAGE